MQRLLPLPSSSSSSQFSTRNWARRIHSRGGEEEDGHSKERIGHYASQLRRCGNARALQEGRLVHSRLACCGADVANTYLANLLVQMYGKCGSLGEAWVAFFRMKHKNIYSWNLMMSAMVRNGRPEEALRLFHRMNADPSPVTFLIALDACSALTSLEHGKTVHKLIINSGTEPDIALYTAIISMYSKCGSAEEARKIFDNMPELDTVAWNAMILAYAHNGHGKEAFELLTQMETQKNPVKPNKITYLSALEACAALGSLEKGQLIHHKIIVGVEENRFALDTALQTALVVMYGKCGSPEHAKRMFDGILRKDKISWTAMIVAYARNGCGEKALQVFRNMELEGVKPDRVAFLGVLDACADLGSLEILRSIHECIVSNRVDSDGAVRNALIDTYGKCGGVKDALAIFDGMERRDPNAWNSMMSAYVRSGNHKEALELFRKMQSRGMNPDRFTFLNILASCAGLASLEKGRRIHEQIVACGYETDISIQTALLNMYGRCGSMKDAHAVFDEMRGHNLVAWTAMVTAYAQNGQGGKALELFKKMITEGMKPDKIAFLSVLDACCSLASLEDGRAIHKLIVDNGLGADVSLQIALLNLYGKCGCLSDARALFDEMHRRDVVAWSAMIATYAQSGQSAEALELFHRMAEEGVTPNRVTFLSVLDACASSSSLRNGKAIHELLASTEFIYDIRVMNALLNMYGKCGNLENAHAVFDEMHWRDAISWSSMIAAYSQNGRCKEAFNVFQQMDFDGIKPDRFTFLSVINACSHAGLLDEGWYHLVSMNQDYGFTVPIEHYLSLTDLLGRGGYKDEAEDMIKNMPIFSDSAPWINVLRAYHIQGDIDGGLRARSYKASPLILRPELTFLEHP